MAQREHGALAGTCALVGDAATGHEGGMLGEVLAEGRDAYALGADLVEQLGGGALPLGRVRRHEVDDAQHVVGDIALFQLFLAGPFN